MFLKSRRLLVAAFSLVLGLTAAAAAQEVYETTPVRKSLQGEKADPVRLRFALSGETTQPGETVTLSITACVTGDYHLFALTQNPEMAGLPTTIELDAVVGLEPVTADYEPDHQPEIERPFEDIVQQVHHGEVTWTRRFRTAGSVTAENAPGIRGRISYQLCGNGNCRPRLAVPFTLGKVSEPVATTVVDPTADDVAPPTTAEAKSAESETEGGLLLYLVYAFIGGMILNVMPCVLPVIAIKVMSFVQQAGESRGRILALNVAYSGGVVTVFVILATLAVVMGMGWGGLFRSAEFNLAMACLVFAMGLSLLGVYEIPVPGLVGSAAGSHCQEGLSGAFFTGVFATLLATPCSGPFLGTTLAWSVRQAPAVTFLIWIVMGLGMSSPYLLFGIFPGAVKYLPKPGNWMVRFREIAGFVLMGTVIFIIYYMSESHVVPTLVMLLGIGLGLWMIGHLYDFSSTSKQKLTVRVMALVLSSAICSFGYGMTRSNRDNGSELPWEQFSEDRLQAALADNKTVLVDFSAKWCLTCKANEKFALNTEETRKLVDDNGIITLYADYTRESPEIKKWLDKFESISVPLTVIFPAGRSDSPIVIRDLYSQATLTENLQTAVTGPGAVTK